MSTLTRIGATLGADVPFCLTGGLARVTGVGDVIEPMEGAPSLPVVLVTPGSGLSTPAVFQRYDAMQRGFDAPDNRALADSLRAGDLRTAQTLSRNALEAPATELMPQVGSFLQWFAAQGAPYVRMSGSGSTVFAAFQTEEEARSVAEKVPGAVLTRTGERGWAFDE